MRGICDITGQTYTGLVKSGKTWVLPVIKAEDNRSAVRPTDEEKYLAWKEEFDRRTV